MGRSVSVAATATIKSRQGGYVAPTNALGDGVGEDTKYLDIAIAAVDPGKCLVSFVGGMAANINSTMLKSGGTVAYEVAARLTSSTNLRIAGVGSPFIGGRWTVLEFA